MPNETNPEQTGQTDPQTSTPQADRPAVSIRFGRFAQWAAAVLSVIALLLGLTVYLHASTTRKGADTSSSVTASASDTKDDEEETVKYEPVEGSVLEHRHGNYRVRLVSLEATGTKATLTAELFNDDPISEYVQFLAYVYQNGRFIRNQGTETYFSLYAGESVQSGESVTITADFVIEDPKQPITLEITPPDEAFTVNFNPQL